FSGGLELIMKDKVRQATVSLPATADGKPTTVRQVILYVRDNLVADKPQLFSTENTVRPGVLVMINDSDWEVEGENDYQVQDKDKILFISTMHGG
ncbi:Ubiquitin- modifier 1, partial [Linderina pennispora]